MNARKSQLFILAVIAIYTTSIVCAEDKPEQLQQVIGEGAGSTPDEALKDAFRSAIRQVVGAVVDAETLVKNDEIINDQVLTYSDGFIKHYDKLSEKKDGSLFRVRISAKVERRSVIAKLKAANVTVKDVDGKGLFAEVVTQLDAEKDAKALVEKALKDESFNCVKAEVIGKPKVVEKDDTKAKIRLAIRIGFDQKVYNIFIARFQKTLEGVAKAHGEFTFKSPRRSPDGGFDFDHSNDLLYRDDVSFLSLMPKAIGPIHSGAGLRENVTCIAVCTQISKLGDRSEWKYYALDQAVNSALLQIYSKSVQIKISLLDVDDKSISVERLDKAYKVITAISATRGELYDKESIDQNHYLERNICWCVAPLAFRKDNMSNTTYDNTADVPVDVDLSLDELKAVHHIKCEITFEAPITGDNK